VKLTPAELAYVRAKGLHITEKCDGDGRLLNQTVRYTITEEPEVYCSAECRDAVFFEDRREVKKRATPKRCAFCGTALEGQRRQALYCNARCKMRCVRAEKARLAGKVGETVTAIQQNQQFADAKVGG
jgi:hypothetical protein